MRYKILTVSAFLALAALVVVRTITYGEEPSGTSGPSMAPKIDPQAAARDLSGALQIATVSYSSDAAPASSAFLAMHDYLQQRFPKVHETLQREVVADLSLLFTWRGSDPSLAPILFSAHMDVVPVETGTEGDWTYPPFSGAVADGYIWGRGALDMKNSLIAYMHAAERLIESGFRPQRTIYFAFTHNEEVGAGAADEIAALLKTRGIRLYYTLDEGLPLTEGIVPGIERPVALVGTAEKGYATIELLATGPGGHSSTPPENTVNERLARALVSVAEHPMPSRLQPPASEMFAHLAADLPLGQRLALANTWATLPVVRAKLTGAPATNALIRTTIAPTILESGVKENVLPQHGRAVLNARLLPGDSLGDVLAHLREVIDDPGIEFNVLGNEPSEASAITRSDTPLFAILRESIHQVFPGVAVAPSLLVGRTDSRRYQEIADSSFRFLPSRLGPEDLRRIHGTDERIQVENFAEIVRFYAQLMINTAGVTATSGN